MAAEKWKESTIRTIKVAQTLLARAEGDVEDALDKDPLPSLRDRCVSESNRRVQDYARSVRTVVVRLRQCFVAVNEELKSMNRTKDSLCRSLNTTRRHININAQTVLVRQARPLREKKHSDIADETLKLEYSALTAHKQRTEMQLQSALHCLQVLGRVRSNVSSVLQERSRATDLLCHSVSSAHRFPGGGRRRHVKALSAPARSNVLFEDVTDDVWTPSVKDALADADEAIADSQRVRKETAMMIEDLNAQQAQLRDRVHEQMVQKIAQTATLAQHLVVNNGETKVTLQASQRHLNGQEKSFGLSLGPISLRDVTTREKLDRPMVRVYQNHPNTDLPEAMYIIGAGNKLTESISITQRNIALLKLARKKMREDERDKKIAMDVDSDIVRMRRREGKPRMLMIGTAMPLKIPTVATS